jgi:hypothetical protein
MVIQSLTRTRLNRTTIAQGRQKTNKEVVEAATLDLMKEALKEASHKTDVMIDSRIPEM